MIMTSQHFLNHVKQIIGRTFHIILFFDMITTYTQLYLVFGGIIDFYSQKIFMVWLFEYSMSNTIGRNIHGKGIKLFYLIEQESVKNEPWFLLSLQWDFNRRSLISIQYLDSVGPP